MVLSLKDKHKHSLFDFHVSDHWLGALSVSLLSSFDICIKVIPNLSKMIAVNSHVPRGGPGRRIKGFFFLLSAREVGEQQAIKQNISIIHFPISCPSLSNRIEFFKNLYREHLIL